MGRDANPFAVLLSSILLLAAAAFAVAGYVLAAHPAYIVTAILVSLAILIPRCLIIANQWERMIVLRLGKLRGIRGPGLFSIIRPLILLPRRSISAFRPPRSTPKDPHPRYRSGQRRRNHLLADT
jgi:hypothetical protein